MIDRALRSYAEPGQVPETRVVLARVMERARASESRSRGWWMWGAVAAAGLAVVVLVGVLVLRGSRMHEIAGVAKVPGAVENIPQRLKPESSGQVHCTAEAVPLQSERQGERAVVGTAEGVPLQSRGRTRRESRAEAKSPPKLEVFPTPRPLTAEEQALVAFVRRAPPAVKKAVVEDQQHWDDPIIVADLRDPSLQSGSHQDQ